MSIKPWQLQAEPATTLSCTGPLIGVPAEPTCGVDREHSTIDLRYLAKIEVERITHREELAPLLINDFDVDEVISKGQTSLSDLPASWNKLNPQERHPFLRSFVPEGLHYESGVVGTTETPSAIK